MAIEFRVLGSLEVLADERQIQLGGSKQRGVLAILLIHRGEVVSADRIADELWGDRPPETAIKTVQVYVSRLRKALGDGALVTHGGGYALEIDADQVDADRFERLAAEGREALDRGEPALAAQTLTEALELCRGPPLADFAYEPFAQNEIARLEELHLVVVENRVESDLALGHHEALVGELEALVAEHPTRERLRGQLMLALYRSGRQSEALQSYQDARRTLDAELGLEPGPELRELEQEILNQDPAIAAPPRGGPAASSRRRRGGVLVAFGGGLLLAAAAAAILAGGEESQLAEANSLAVIDPESNRVVDTVPTGIDPADVSGDADHVWVANRGDNSVTEIDPETKAVVQTTPAHTSVGGMAAGAGGVWIGDSRGEELVQLDSDVPSAWRSIRLARARPFDVTAVNPVAVGQDAIWVLGAQGVIARVDPKSNQVVDDITATSNPTAIATGSGRVWVADAIDNAVSRIDPASANAVTKTIPVGQGPSAIAVGEGAVWVANTQDDTVSRIDPHSAAVIQTIAVGTRPSGIAAAAGAVWVTNTLDGTVSRIDPETNTVEASVEVGEAPQGLMVADGLVWVSVEAGAEVPDSPSNASAGDVARVVVPAVSAPSSIDPALGSAGSDVAFATCALLYNYPDRPFPFGSRLRPELVAGEPLVSNHGRTYRFRIQPGFRFSPPSNEPVTAAAFERTLQRVLSPKINSYGRLAVRDVIVGAHDYRADRTNSLEGVSAHDGVLVIRLTRPVADLPARLTSQYLCAVPPDTPRDAEAVDPVASAGPYYVDSYVPNRSLVLLRNPNYRGERPQGLEEIRFDYGVPAERGVEEVEAGRADYVVLQPEGAQQVRARVQKRLESRYGPRSEAARAGRQQLFSQSRAAVDSYVFNTQRGPFADPRLRRAVNYAINRPALSKDTGFGSAGKPTDQYIPPGIPGFEDAAIYPLGGPDLATARRLAGDEHHQALLYTVDWPGYTRNAEILRSNLEAIGIDLEVRKFPSEPYFRTIVGSERPWDIASWGWLADYADPSNFINDQFGPHAEHPHGFRDPDVWRRMAAAARLTGEARLRAYARLDRDLAEQVAPAAPYASGFVSHFLSERMGCQVLHPLYDLDLAALCVRDEEE